MSVACLAVMLSLCFNFKFRSNDRDNFSAPRAKIYFLLFQELFAWQGIDPIDRRFKTSDQKCGEPSHLPWLFDNPPAERGGGIIKQRWRGAGDAAAMQPSC